MDELDWIGGDCVLDDGGAVRFSLDKVLALIHTSSRRVKRVDVATTGVYAVMYGCDGGERGTRGTRGMKGGEIWTRSQLWTPTKTKLTQTVAYEQYTAVQGQGYDPGRLRTPGD